MHDVVREMALWIASDLGKQKEAFIVRAGVGLSEIPMVKNWNVVRRMSLMHNMIRYLNGSPECPVLTTFLLQEGYFSRIPREFFKSMPKLVVLDLSGNRYLFKLPEGISNLVSLQYLNLSDTGIRHLPKGLQKLRKLIHLDLEETVKLESIAGISSLQSLKVLKLYDSGFTWDLNTVEELEDLEHLEVLTITIDYRSPGAEKYLSSHRLMRCTQSRKIKQLESSGILFLENVDQLRKFSITDSSISEIKMGKICSSLVEVDIDHCKGLRELTFLMFAPNLRFLSVDSLHDLEDIINEDKAREIENSGILPFPKLSYLHLQQLPKLKNIYWSPLPFPCLKTVYITGSLYLKKLPLDSKSGDNGIIITYIQKKWIKGVEWEDEATKTRFLPLCIQDPLYAAFESIQDV